MGRLVMTTLLFLAMLTACSIPRLVPIPLRDADLYPESQTKEGVSVAVDGLTRPQRIKRYFGMDLTRNEMLPINIIVSNHGQGRYVIKPSDVLLMIDKQVVDPLPIEAVEETLQDEYGGLSAETIRKVNSYFAKVMFRETIVSPRQNYQGIIFLKNERREEGAPAAYRHRFSMAQLFREGEVKVRIAVTDIDTSQRILFGPFSLPGL